MSQIRVAWMYHDIMDLYGDRGNMLTLKKRCEDRGIDFELDRIGIGQEADLSQYDLVFLGGGADKEQMSLIPDLLSRKENIRRALSENTFFLLICGGYQLFGQYYETADHTKIEGLGFYGYHTDTGANGTRCIGNIVIDATLDDLQTRIVGFENHGGQTLDVEKPLGQVLVGKGNAFGAGYEGVYDGKILGTYLHGPLLPKNPEVADFVIARALAKRQPGFTWKDLAPLDDELEKDAREVLFQRFNLD